MATTAGTSMLNYNDKRQKAMSASYERVKIAPVNGNTFSLSNSIDFKIPNMNKGNFLDFHHTYFKVNIATDKASDAAIHNIYLPRNGVYNIFDRIEIITSSQTISVIDEYAKLVNIFLDSECGLAFKASTGSAQYGMGSLKLTEANCERGQLLTAVTTGVQDNYFCFPLMLSNLMSASKYLAMFSSDNVILRFTLSNLTNGFISSNGNTSTVTIKKHGDGKQYSQT